MTRRPLRPIPEEGRFYIQRKPSLSEKIDDAIIIALATIGSLILFPFIRQK